MSTEIPPFVPDPRPGQLPDPAVPPMGPETIPDVPDVDVPGELPEPGEEPRQPPERDQFPEEPVPNPL